MVVAGLVLLLAVVLAAAPYVAASLARPRIESALEHSFAVEASLDELSFGWTGRAHAGRLVVKDLAGEPLLSVERLDGRIAPLGLLTRDYDGDGRARGVEIHLRRDANGRWNVQDLPRAPREEPPVEGRPPAQPRELPELALDFVLEATQVFVHDASAGTFTIGPLESALSVPSLDRPATFQLEAPVRTPDGRQGRLAAHGALLAVRERRIDWQAMTGTLDLELGDLPLDVVASLGFLPEAIAELAGLAGGTLHVELEAPASSARRVRGQGKLAFRDFDFALASAEGAEPFAVHEDELGLELTLDGPLVWNDLDGLLAGMEAEADLELAPFETSGFALGGDLSLVMSGGRAKLRGALDLNGGKAELAGDLGLAARTAGPSTLSMKVEGARARGELAPLLGHVHPVFAGLAHASAGTLSGTVSTELALSWPTSGLLAQIELGKEGLDLSKLSGRGTFGLGQAKLDGSPLYDQLLTLLGKQGESELTLTPLSFGIDAGRLTYDEPWTWTIAGTKTSFGGSIGLDGTLGLAWSVPLEASFVKKQGLPAELTGRTLTLPLAGTIDNPRLEWKGALDALVEGALQDELAGRVEEVKRDLEEKIGEKLGDELDDLLGGKGGDDPEALLRQADELWSQGKKDQARPIYQRLREEFKLTPTYLLNRDRIKERAKD